MAAQDRATASATLAAVADAVIATDDKNRITVFNDAAERLFGLGRDQVLGRSMSDVAAMRPLMEASDLPIELSSKTGRVRQVLVSTGDIKASSGRAWVLHDITARERTAAALAASENERVQTERKLESSRRMSAVAEVSAAIAHELNQPLAALTTYATTAQKSIRRDADAVPNDLSELIEKIASQANRSAQVVRKLRSVFEQARPTGASKDLAQTLLVAVELAKRENALDSADIELNIPSKLPAVAHDSLQLQQLLLNLVRNSVEAQDCSDRLRIVIDVHSRSEREVAVEIADNGPGIAAHLQDELFEPLSSNKPGGLGIGLAICRSIAEAHGGALSYVQSASGGARFVLSLPRSI